MATHSNILAWRIPWTEKPGRLQSMGSQRVRHNRSGLTSKGISLEIPLDFTRKVSLKKLPETCTINTCVHAKLLQSCPTLCKPMDCSPPGSSVCKILQARILEWVAMPSSRGSSRSRDGTQVSCIASRFFTVLSTREAL